VKTVIICTDTHGSLGDEKGLVWDIAEEKALFRENLKRFIKPIYVVGRNTFVHSYRVLKKYCLETGGNIAVISTTMISPEFPVFSSYEALLASDLEKENLVILGGPRVYNEAFKHGVDEVFLSMLKKNYSDKAKAFVNMDLLFDSIENLVMNNKSTRSFSDFDYYEFIKTAPKTQIATGLSWEDRLNFFPDEDTNFVIDPRGSK